MLRRFFGLLLSVTICFSIVWLGVALYMGAGDSGEDTVQCGGGEYEKADRTSPFHKFFAAAPTYKFVLWGFGDTCK